ncbi:MAG: hypothetical protein DBY25_04225 [Clostridiales bacterium]|nr:MAG: hypothetical protein DBY25_04225 [Clostridiales bacterium]
MPVYHKKRRWPVPLIIIAILLIVLAGTILIQQELDRAHAQEAEEFKLSLTVSVDQPVTAPGEEVLFTASATGGKGELHYEFYYMNGDEKVVVREASEHNTARFTMQELGLIHMMVTVSDESPWTADATAEVRYGAAHQGIDVSVYQRQIDWAKVKDAGMDFAMLRTGFGEENPEKDQRDARFSENVQGAHAAGLKVGAYHFSYALTAEDAKKEAEFCLSILEPYRELIDYPIAFDIESEEHQALSEEELVAVVNAFCGPIAAAGFTPIVYTYDSWLVYHPGWEQLTHYDLWIANWAEAPQSDYDYILWQYTNQGQIDGIATNVDLNYAFCDYEKGVQIR